MCIPTARQVHFLYLASQVAGFVAVFLALAAVYGSGSPTLCVRGCLGVAQGCVAHTALHPILNLVITGL